MPEGDTIFRAARAMHRVLAGHRVTRFESVFPALTRVQDDRAVVGRTIARVESVGKHLLVVFSDDLILRTHMRMSGSWHLYRPGEAWQRPARDLRILIGTDDWLAIAFTVHDAEFETAHTLQRQTSIGRLGPDLLNPDFDAAEALARLRARGEEAIADAILNQQVIAGIGNVYKSEVLFVSRLNPFAPVSALTDEELRTILATGQRLLKANVTSLTESTIVTYVGLRRTTGRMDPSDRLWVYGRARRPCRRCGTPIDIAKQGRDARLTYWCPRCQPARAPSAAPARSDAQ